MIIVRCNKISKTFPSRHGRVKAIDDLSLDIRKGEVFGLVGESGSGKTTLGKIALGLIKPDSGTLELNTERPQVIFQDPYNSLDPRMRIREIIEEGMAVTKGYKGIGYKGIGRPGHFSEMPGHPAPMARERIERIEKILDLVKLPKEALRKYPHQFSGGERQRIAIARALVTDPEFIVCDEPVSSLDVTIQLQILKLLKDIRKDLGITYLFISHDLRVIRFMCDRVAVMKDGKMVEEGPVDSIYNAPGNPYTRQLLASVPHPFNPV